MMEKKYNKVIGLVIVVVVVIVVLYAAWHAVMPGYFAGAIKFCTRGCHTTIALKPEKITGPFWCIGCHGFGVKSEVAPGLPLVRYTELEELKKKVGECVKCHRVPEGQLHKAHMEAVEKGKTVMCIDCHVDAYRGHHTLAPTERVCIMCHDPVKAHKGVFLGPARTKCLSCHGDKPAYQPAKLMAESYGGTSAAATALGFDIRPACLACHKPEQMGHIVHVVKSGASCSECHKPDLKHGTPVPLGICSECHKPTVSLEAHKKHVGAVFKGREITCLDCHQFTDEPVKVCLDCHSPVSAIAFHELMEETVPCKLCHSGWDSGKLYMFGKGCTGCHPEAALKQRVSIGLHAAHTKYVPCVDCHCIEKVKTHEQALTLPKKLGNRLCYVCHDSKTGDLKAEIAKKYGVIVVTPKIHKKLVELGEGDCLSCHYQWLVPKFKPITYLGG